MAATMSSNWAHAVPLDHADGDDNNHHPAPPQRADTFGSQDSGTAAYRQPARRANDAPPDAGRDSRPQSRRPSVQSNSSVGPRKRSSRPLRQQQHKSEDRDDSPWIHRDKLAQIEIQEMEEAGMHVRQPRRSDSIGQAAVAPAAHPERSSSRSVSRSGPARPQSKGAHYEHNADEELDRRKRVSTIPAEDDDEEWHDRSFDHHIDSELRTPDEVAAEHYSPRHHAVRPSTSRIPISKASAPPVAYNVVERESPMPETGEELNNAGRARRGSPGSDVVMDDAHDFYQPPAASAPASDGTQMRSSPVDRTPHSRSPPKSRPPNKDGPMSGARKTTTAGASRAASAQRPPSSAGNKARPSTSHKVEGEAPWIATMYKPDPRLPPDQQLLPTHAKRMMQEQWEKEGKTGTAYDRDFRLINDTEIRQPSPVSSLEPDSKRRPNQPATLALSPGGEQNKENRAPPSPLKNSDPWPLSPLNGDRRSDTGSPRPGTSGGYRITPTISAQPPVQRPPTSGGAAPPEVANTDKPVPRVPDLDEKQEARPKKGCCCAMM